MAAPRAFAPAAAPARTCAAGIAAPGRPMSGLPNPAPPQRQAAMGRGGLEAIFLNHRSELLRFLRARGAGDMAEDLVQELWLKASADVAGPIQDPLAYLYRAANNLMLDRHRAARRAARRDEDWTDATHGLGEASDAPSAEAVLIARDDLRQAERALAELGPRTEAIFRRFRIDGVNQRRIAEEMGLSLSAVEKHLQRAYRALLGVRSRLDAE